MMGFEAIYSKNHPHNNKTADKKAKKKFVFSLLKELNS